MCSCGYIIGYRVEQEVSYAPYSADVNLYTSVWHDGEIIQMWKDDVDKVTPALVKHRAAQADSLIVALKLMR